MRWFDVNRIFPPMSLTSFSEGASAAIALELHCLPRAACVRSLFTLFIMGAGGVRERRHRALVGCAALARPRLR